MTLKEAKKIVSAIKGYIAELDTVETPEDNICLDGWFNADQLEALAIVMRASSKG